MMIELLHFHTLSTTTSNIFLKEKLTFVEILKQQILVTVFVIVIIILSLIVEINL